MMPPLRSFDDVDGRERGQKKTDDLRAMATLGLRTLHVNTILKEITGKKYATCNQIFITLCNLSNNNHSYMNQSALLIELKFTYVLGGPEQ